MYFELDNDDMESSKRRSIFRSLIAILKCQECSRTKFLKKLYFVSEQLTGTF